ncbi:MAG: hypothetical protein Hyperionvirus3_157 [Hyperionvirus sp.]|uniref:Uncharacterized protein n=1 Tax=Hyperionvirus sp. TaxID=2487770 RepID=A0A3G5A9Y9_9VIRU|nr:MAG: hypothetical protein Hyperionvirus3_157 [Hyperionvirus sp.]
METEIDDNFFLACEKGIVSYAQEIYMRCRPNINSGEDFVFRHACRDGNLEMAKWLLSIPNSDVNINARNDNAFRSACRYGHLEIGKWLLSLPNNNIDINAENSKAFDVACRNGHVEIAKWLLSMSTNNIISIDMDWLFMCCCLRGHLETAKWLLSASDNNKWNININARDDDVFATSCWAGQFEIVEWLLSLHNNNIDINRLRGYSHYPGFPDGYIKIIKLLVGVYKISNEPINKIFQGYRSIVTVNEELVKYLFDNCYYPTNDNMIYGYVEYKRKEVAALDKIVGGSYLLSDLWKIVYSY